jgi:hypothetical protein
MLGFLPTKMTLFLGMPRFGSIAPKTSAAEHRHDPYRTGAGQRPGARRQPEGACRASHPLHPRILLCRAPFTTLEDFNRQSDLWKAKLTTRQEYDRAENTLRVQEYTKRSAEQSIARTEQAIRQITADLANAEHDLSKVMFVGTANLLDPIPGPLKDRMEILELPGYSEDQKIMIAKQFLIPKQVSEHGLTSEYIEFKDEDELSAFVIRLAQKCGKHISLAEPMLDATMPDGSRIQMTLSTEVTTKGSTFTIRKFSEDPFSPPDLIEFNTMSSEMVAYMWLAVENGINALIAGGTDVLVMVKQKTISPDVLISLQGSQD